MNKIRIIPRLDIKGPNLVKGIHLEGLRVLGKPEDLAQYYYLNGADELFFQDTVASLYSRNQLDDVISKTARKIFIPLTVGGGLRNIDDVKRVLRLGADKVCINTAAIKNPQLIKQAAEKFGSSTIVIAIEVIKDSDGVYRAYTDNGREETGKKALEWAEEVAKLGAGELLVTSVDKEGTGEGFDMELLAKISNTISIPIVAHGGCGSVQDVVQVFQNTNIDAVAVASILHYGFIKNNFLNHTFEEEGNISFLRSGRVFNKIKTCTIIEMKNELMRNNISVRL